MEYKYHTHRNLHTILRFLLGPPYQLNARIFSRYICDESNNDPELQRFKSILQASGFSLKHINRAAEARSTNKITKSARDLRPRHHWPYFQGTGEKSINHLTKWYPSSGQPFPAHVVRCKSAKWAATYSPGFRNKQRHQTGEPAFSCSRALRRNLAPQTHHWTTFIQ